MKSFVLLLGVGLVASCPAAAQTTTPARTTAPTATGTVVPSSIPRIPPAGVPGEPGALPAGVPGAAAQPGNATGLLYPHGVPVRDTDAGNTRSAQPRSGQATPGAQPTKSIFKGRSRSRQ